MANIGKEVLRLSFMSRGNDNSDCEVREQVLVDQKSSNLGPRQARACTPAPVIDLSSLLVRICNENIIALFNSLVKSHIPRRHSSECPKTLA
jgi:hypothetical protein